MSTLSLNNVTYKYRSSSTAAVKDATCSFEPGKLYAIVGPSGSGKSTLLSMMAGLDLPTEGEVSYDGESLRDMDLDRYRREDISMIFQAFQLFPLLTVMENVCYPMELVGADPKEAKKRAEQYLEKVGITKEQMKRFPSHLSGGEQQRVAIARALINHPAVVYADEPTGNLDAGSSENVAAMLALAASKYRQTIIMVTHDKQMAGYADRVLSIVDGNVSTEVNV